MILVDLSGRGKLTDVEGVEIVIFRGEEEDGGEGRVPGERVGLHL